ncbi:MAG: hypothetical protein DMG57_11200 [Acidobacteria bacterium]|nr:MAG: hypothetical protein DMG57_11200 [Acidobacteriota bacterium]
MVLLIACANLANLMLAQASTREREMAVRLALGASRARLLRQLLVESILLAGMGAALGVSLALLLSRVLVWSLSTASNSVDLSIATDWRVLCFAASVAALTCVIFGAVPARRATNAEPVSAMKASGRGIAGARERFSMQRVICGRADRDVARADVKCAAVRASFRKLITFDPGMREAGITVAFVAFQQSHVTPGRYDEFQRQLLAEVRSVPGILGVATTTNTPLLGSSWEHGIHTARADGTAKFTWVSPGYFETMGIPWIIGRDFSQNDTAASERVAVVNQAFVRQFLAGANPVGKTLRVEQEGKFPSTVYAIVGLIPDTKYSDLRGETPAMIFAPASQFPAPGPFIMMMIRSSALPAAVMSTVKRKIAEKHPEIVAVGGDFQTMIRDGLVRERVMAMLSGFFGLLAALLAMVGLYGVISYMVARRRNEIGIRIALTLSSSFNEDTTRRLRLSETTLISREGFVLPQKYKHHSEYFRLMTGRDAIIDWLKHRGITAQPSDPGRIADQILSSLGGFWGTNLLADRGTIKLLDEMAKSVRRHADGTVEEFPDRSIDDVKRWKDLVSRRSNARWGHGVRLDRFVEANIFRLGLVLACPSCQKKNWFGIENLRLQLTCERCLKTFAFPQGIQTTYGESRSRSRQSPWPNWCMESTLSQRRRIRHGSLFRHIVLAGILKFYGRSAQSPQSAPNRAAT